MQEWRQQEPSTKVACVLTMLRRMEATRVDNCVCTGQIYKFERSRAVHQRLLREAKRSRPISHSFLLRGTYFIQGVFV